ncbi:MAG: hypothetical protein ACM3X9_12230 [Bacillota bacterium]
MGGKAPPFGDENSKSDDVDSYLHDEAPISSNKDLRLSNAALVCSDVDSLSIDVASKFADVDSICGNEAPNYRFKESNSDVKDSDSAASDWANNCWS